MSDLFCEILPFPAKAKKPREPVPPFYCYHCAATHSQRCKKCGERYCGNSMSRCSRDPHVCAALRQEESND